MLSDRDRKNLEGSVGKRGRLSLTTCIFACGFLLAMAALNLYLAARWAELQGHTLSDLLKGLLEGIQADRQYSGTYLRGLDRVEVAVVEIGVAIIGGAQGIVVSARQRLNRRVIAALKRHGAW